MGLLQKILSMVLRSSTTTSEELEEFESIVGGSDLDSDYIQPETDSDSITIEHNQETNEIEVEEENVDINASLMKKSRKRQRKPESWICNERKRKRTAGEEYIAKNKKNIPSRRMRGVCKDTCKMKCPYNFSNEDRKKIFKQFWSESTDNNVKRQFVASCVKIEPVQRRRVRTGQKQRNTSLHYHFLKNNKTMRVCKVFFLNTLNISQTYVETALSKRSPEGGVISDDLRGKKIPPNKISEAILQQIREHISRFPTEESHYRRSTSSKKYLDGSLNITKMHELYVEECQEKNNEIGKLWLYSKIFNNEFNLAFKKPYNDTCDFCDSSQLKVRDASTSEEKQKLQEVYNHHLKDASDRYQLKKLDKDMSRQDPTQKVIMVDLEKCLPTPVLSNAQSFYSLKLWTFNYTIHDATDKKTYCCMFDESVAGRGVNEMASCLLKWIDSITLHPTLKKLIIWSDNCPSQNRNFGMIMCYFMILEKYPQLETIEHKFLLRGHTYLEADSAHSIIEREWKKQTQFKIMVPWDWQQLVRMCIKKNPFTVISMEKGDFLNIKSLYKGQNAPFMIRKRTNTNEQFLISKVVYLQVRATKRGILYFKNTFKGDFKEIDLNKNRRVMRNIPQMLPQAPFKGISTEKHRHLLALLKWVPKIFHPFYQNLKHAENADDGD